MARAAPGATQRGPRPPGSALSPRSPTKQTPGAIASRSGDLARGGQNASRALPKARLVRQLHPKDNPERSGSPCAAEVRIRGDGCSLRMSGEIFLLSGEQLVGARGEAATQPLPCAHSLPLVGASAWPFTVAKLLEAHDVQSQVPELLQQSPKLRIASHQRNDTAITAWAGSPSTLSMRRASRCPHSPRIMIWYCRVPRVGPIMGSPDAAIRKRLAPRT